MEGYENGMFLPPDLESKNTVINQVLHYKDNLDYFKPKIAEVFKRKYNFSSDQVSSAFLQVTVEETVYGKYIGSPLYRIKEYILKGTGNINLHERSTQDLKQVINNLLRECVESEQTDALRKVLFWYKQELSTLVKLKTVIESWDSKYDPGTPNRRQKIDGFSVNNQAMVRACEKDNFEMVVTFLKYNFTLNDLDLKPCEKELDAKADNFNFLMKEKAREKNCLWGRLPKFPLICNNYVEERRPDILNSFKIFKATAQPAYLIAEFLRKIEQRASLKADEEVTIQKEPLSESFHNAHIARIHQQKIVEYKTKFMLLETESKRFAVQMLDLCKNTDEAVLLLAVDMKIEHYYDAKVYKSMIYPRLELAVLDRHMEFVTHDYTQQILRTCWFRSDLTGEVLRWNSNLADQTLYLAQSLLFSPIYALAYLPLLLMKSYKELILEEECTGNRQSQWDSLESLTNRHSVLVPSHTICSSVPKFLKLLALHYTFPFNRFVAHFTSHLVYTLLILLVAINPLDKVGTIDMDWYDYLAILYSLAYLYADFQEAKNRRFLFTDYNFIFRLLVLLGLLVKGIGYLKECPGNDANVQFLLFGDCRVDNPADLTYDKSRGIVVVGYVIYGLGMTMAMLKILYWSQLHHVLGPLAISIKKVIKDLVLVAFAYFLFLFAFSVGIKYVLELSQLDFCDEDEIKMAAMNNTTDRVLLKYSTLLNKSVAVNVQYGNSPDKTFNHFRTYKDAFKTSLWSLFEPGHPEVVGCSRGTPRYYAMMLWWVYQCINVIILMNLLIAMMNTSMQVIQSDTVTQWKFARTEIWLKFLDKRKGLPVPLNLVEVFLGFFLAMGNNFCGRTAENEKIPHRKHSNRYHELVRDLCKRYLNMMEDSKENEVTKEDLDIARRDIIKLFQAGRAESKV